VATGHLVSTVLTLVVIPLLYYALLQRMRPKEDAGAAALRLAMARRRAGTTR
jgi:hypothetical protein